VANKVLGLFILCIPFLSLLAFAYSQHGVEGIRIFAFGVLWTVMIVLCVVVGLRLLNKEP
jgi:hypothetical protein